MKKIIALFVFVLGFSFSSKAQEVTTENNTQVQAKTLAIKIKDYLHLDDAKTKAVYEIINHKSTMINNEPNLIDERKQLINNKFAKKLESTLSPDELKKLKANKSLYDEFMKA